MRLRSNADLIAHQSAQHPSTTKERAQINPEAANTITSKHECGKCGLSFVRKRLLISHKNSSKPVDLSSGQHTKCVTGTCLKCLRCKVPFRNRDQLRRHSKRKNCQQNIQARTNSNTTQLEVETHEITPELSGRNTTASKGDPMALQPSTKLECTICNITFTRKWSLELHLTRKCRKSLRCIS